MKYFIRTFIRDTKLIFTGKLKTVVTRLVLIRRAREVRMFKEETSLKNRMSQIPLTK
jgi:hypothetical protein